MALESGLFIGSVRHRRFSPISHQFRNSIFMPLINLDELDLLEKNIIGFNTKKFALASFYCNDYFAGEKDTKKAAQDKLYELTGNRVSGKVLALCQLRYFGLYFSPVNFYYLFDENNHWCYMLAEVSNTPWNQRHYYAIPAQKKWQHLKEFHVSPFNPMEQKYNWTLRPINHKAFLHLEVSHENREFDATLALNKREFNNKEFLFLIAKTPIITIKILVAIYWQALKLWIKGARFYPHSVSSKE